VICCVSKILHDKLERKVQGNNFTLVLHDLHDKLERKVQGNHSKLVLCL
jgi:hypothetical protein